MKQISIHGLMGKIYNYNNDIPLKIRYYGNIYYYRIDICDYECETSETDFTYLFDNPMGKSYKEFLHDYVEIIEENNKIEKYKHIYEKTAIEDYKMARFNSNDMEKICNRIGWLMENNNDLGKIVNQIIDKVNEMNNED